MTYSETDELILLAIMTFEFLQIFCFDALCISQDWLSWELNGHKFIIEKWFDDILSITEEAVE